MEERLSKYRFNHSPEQALRTVYKNMDLFFDDHLKKPREDSDIINRAFQSKKWLTKWYNKQYFLENTKLGSTA